MVTLARVRVRLGTVEAGFTDPVLQEFLDTASNDYGLTEGQDDAMIITLTLCFCYQKVATEAASFFKYSQGSESVDKTMVAEQYRKLYETTWASIAGSLPGRASPDSFVLRKNEVPEDPAEE